MVDFKKLRAAKSQQVITDPIEIFRRLPKPPGINDLYGSQQEVLEAWKKNHRTDRDVVIKLHTGGGKTLVALLIAQSIMNETREPVVYLAPTVQLVQQTLAKAEEYGIPAVPYEKGTGDFQESFLSGQSVLICAYEALFSGTSRFGVRGGHKEIVSAAAIILDDAHVAFSRVRDSFTLKIEKDKDPGGYAYLTNMFRADFQEIGKGGTFDDIVGGADFGVVEVPYWNWKARSFQVSEYLRPKATKDYVYSWPLLRDAFDHCHAIITRSAFVVTPTLPLVDMIPTFESCPHRIFMSATIGDDSEIVRTFDADPKSVAEPITSKSLAGVSERMILVPDLMELDNVDQTVSLIAEWTANTEKLGTVILVPSDVVARKWTIASFAEGSTQVSECVERLLDGRSTGPVVFSNRYDGIDLPGQACRLLILAGLPRGMSEYDQYRANTLSGGTAIHAAIARRVEQGMGRGARGANDFCVVLITDKDLVAWISRSSNLKLLTSSTRAQLKMGMTISKDVKTTKDLAKTIRLCFKRDKEWMEYHADELADLTDLQDDTVAELSAAAIERKALQLMRDGYWDKAVARLEKYTSEAKGLDAATVSWLRQMAARAAEYWGNESKALDLQQAAYAANKNLLRPKVLRPYEILTIPGKQAACMVAQVEEFSPRQGFLAYFDEVAAHLVPEASPTQFEQALADFGAILGFKTERPDKKDKIGPDVLWLHEELAFVLEAKSRKKFKNALTKDDVGQLLGAREWFRENYPGHSHVAASVLPKAVATKAASTGDTKALTFTWLNDLIAETRSFFQELCDSAIPSAGLQIRCEKLLKESTLRPQRIAERYFSDFTHE